MGVDAFFVLAGGCLIGSVYGHGFGTATGVFWHRGFGL